MNANLKPYGGINVMTDRNRVSILWQKIHLIAIVVGLISIVFVASSIIFLHDFLCLNKAYSSGTLVVEGWIPDISLNEIPFIYFSGNYKMLVVVGGPIISQQTRKNGLTAADRAKSRLIEKGIEKDSIFLVQYTEGQYHHTYRSAIALKDWLSKSNPDSHFIDIYTVGVHARKSYITFKRVLSPYYEVGVLSGKPLYYCPQTWFLSKKGIFLVYKNFFGYLYGKLFPFDFWLYNTKS
jgi:hypothetical protein